MHRILITLMFFLALPAVADEQSWSATRTVTDSNNIEYQADDGRIRVPEVRSDPDSRMIEIAFVRIRSRSKEPDAPLFYLAGGPGSPATPIADNPRALSMWSAVLDRSDVVLVDQRGTGRSDPNLMYTVREANPAELFLTEQSAMRFVRESSKEAIAQFREQGIDLRGYTTAENADDIEAIRKAIGSDRITLFGFSYGTHLGLAYISRHGEHLDRAVLVGVEGLDETYKLPIRMDTQWRKLALMSAGDPAVSDAGDLDELLGRVLASLAKKPAIVTVVDPRTNESVDVAVGEFGLRLALRFDIGDRSDLPVFPRLLHSIDRGDFSVLQWFVQKRYAMFTRVFGLAMIMDPASGASIERLASIERQAANSRFGNISNFPFPDTNDLWSVPALGEEFRRPVVSDRPVLLLSGTLDWNTPPFQAERVRWGLTNATHIVVDEAGHEQILTHPRVGEAIVRFLAGQDVSDIQAGWPPLQFVPLGDESNGVSHPSIKKEVR